MPSKPKILGATGLVLFLLLGLFSSLGWISVTLAITVIAGFVIASAIGLLLSTIAKKGEFTLPFRSKEEVDEAPEHISAIITRKLWNYPHYMAVNKIIEQAPRPVGKTGQNVDPTKVFYIRFTETFSEQHKQFVAAIIIGKQLRVKLDKNGNPYNFDEFDEEISKLGELKFFEYQDQAQLDRELESMARYRREIGIRKRTLPSGEIIEEPTSLEEQIKEKVTEGEI